MNQHVNYPGQSLFHSKVIVRTHRCTHIRLLLYLDH